MIPTFSEVNELARMEGKRTWSSKDGIVLSSTHFTRIYIIRAKRVLCTNSGLIISSLLNRRVLPLRLLEEKINKICGESRGRLGDSL